VTHKYYWRVFFSGLPLHRKLGFCYLFHLRWILLLAAVLAAVINPLLMSPLMYPLETWSLPIQICVSTAVCSYLFVAVLGLSASLQHDRQRPLAIVALGFFFLLGWLYVVLHFSTHTIAFIKVFTGNEGGWQVTTRSIKGTSPATMGNVNATANANRCRVSVAPALTEPLLCADAVETEAPPSR